MGSTGMYSFLYPSLHEITEPEEAKLTGNLPDWICGTVIRNGPGRFDFEDGFTVTHFLDGWGSS
jgi:carotenoid cleavage dioxygenase-like enzyme